MAPREHEGGRVGGTVSHGGSQLGLKKYPESLRLWCLLGRVFHSSLVLTECEALLEIPGLALP